MAMSKPGTQDAGQHYLVCNTEGCQSNCQFYCNACHQEMCEECRDEHLKNPDNRSHEVVPYRQRRHQLPKEKCKHHPTRNIDMHCDDCNISLCSQCCTMEDHWRHELVDLETIYSENCAECQGKIRQIYQYFIPTSEELRQETNADITEIKKIMDDIRASVKAEGERLKKLVEKVILQKIDGVNGVEKTITDMLQNQGKTYEDYISYLKDVVKEFSGYLSSTQLIGNPMISTVFGQFITIKSIPQTTKPFPSVFTPGQFSEEDVSKLLGTVNVSKYKPKNRAIKPMELLKPTDQMKQNEKKSDVKQTLSLSSFVTKVKEYAVPGVERAYHVSLGKSGSVWVSDEYGNLVQTDQLGNALQKIKARGGERGCHTVTQDMDLIYADRSKHVIKRITMDNKVTKFIKTGDCVPLSIHSSKINGDILVGMKKGFEGKVSRYNKTGREIQSVQRDDKEQELYIEPHYITENINGDICTSDVVVDAVVVVNKSGHHRFSYTHEANKFLPHSICTDVLGHIIVCVGHYEHLKVNVLDQDGQFLRSLLKNPDITLPCSVCIDDKNNLHVGQYHSNKVTVFKYLK